MKTPKIPLLDTIKQAKRAGCYSITAGETDIAKATESTPTITTTKH